MLGVGCLCPEHLVLWTLSLIPMCGLAWAWWKMKRSKTSCPCGDSHEHDEEHA